MMQTGERLLCTNSKPPGPIIKIGQSETGRSGQIIFITLVSCNSLYQAQQSVAQMLAQKPNPPHVSTFLPLILICRDTNWQQLELLLQSVIPPSPPTPNWKLPQKAKITLTIEGEGKQPDIFGNFTFQQIL